jgi:AmmeMemoRadiSam system protein A
MNPHALRLDEREKAFLRDLARETIAAAVAGTPPPDPRERAQAAGLPLSEALEQDRGAFVTLHRDGRLRGCIGTIVGRRPLLDAVADNAVRAALHDPRFPPVGPGETPLLDIEVSALTPLRTVGAPEEIEIGRHGVLLEKNGRQAVFLPQVAPEQGWDLPTTLAHLCLKAGLGPGDWHEGARLQVFEADVF